jgi:hypothetical protein
MSNIIKSLFNFKSKKLSKEDILDQWRKSNKHLQTAEDTIFKLDDEGLLDTLNTIDIRTIIHLNSLIASLKRRENRTVFEPIIQHLDFCAKVFDKLDIFDYGYVLLNKYDLLENVLRVSKENALLDVLYGYYFTESNYLSGVVYALQKRSSILLRFFLSLDSKNITILSINGFRLEKGIRQCFVKQELDDAITSDIAVDYVFNMILQLDRRGIDYSPILHNKEIHIEEMETLLVLIELYHFYKKSKNSIKDKHKLNLLKFTNSEIFDIFNNKFVNDLGKSNKDAFEHFTNGLFGLIKRTANTIFYQRISYLPIYILEIMVLGKSPISNIELFITSWLEREKDQKDTLLKFLLKQMIENYTDSNDSMILEMLKKLSPIFKCESIVDDLELKINIIDLLGKHKIVTGLLELVRSEFLILSNKITFTESDLYKRLLDYYFALYKARRTRYSFIDDNNKSNVILGQYLKRFPDIEVVDIVIDMIKHNGLKSEVLKILNDNPMFFNDNVNTIDSLIDTFIEAKNEMDLSNEAIYGEFLNDIKTFIQKYQYVDKSVILKLQNISRYYKISSVFVNNTIDGNLKEFDYKKLNLIDILEIFILKKFNIDQIIDVNDFMGKTDDIFEAFGVDKNEYLSLLFQFFFKYQKECLYTEILEYFAENNYKAFEECIARCKKNTNFNLKIFFVKNPKLKLKLLECTERYEYLEEIIEGDGKDVFKPGDKVKFNAVNEDIVCLFDLAEKIQDYPKGFERINRDEILADIRANRDFKTKLVSFIMKTSENLKTDTKKTTFKYSLHPKLVKLLKDINYKHSGKEFEFNTKLSLKFKLYRHFLTKNLANLGDILEWENLTRLDSYNDVFNINKLLINIHSDKLTFEQYIDNDIVRNHKAQLIQDLVLFNLSYLKYFNMRHFQYIQMLDNEFIELDQNNLRIYELIDSICDGKFNLLLMAKNYSTLDNKIKEEVKKLYSGYTNNVYYFKHSKISAYELLITMEIFKHLNLNNFINFYKVNAILALGININLLFGIKLCVSLNNISCVINQAKKGTTEIIQILSSLHITDDEFKTLSSDLFNLPTLNFILESHMNINILEKNYTQSLQDFITTKLLLVDDLLNKVPVLAKWPILIDKLKILRIKHHVLHNIEDSQVIATYNNIKDLNDYTEIESMFRRDNRMKEQIRNIYSKLN